MTVGRVASSLSTAESSSAVDMKSKMMHEIMIEQGDTYVCRPMVLEDYETVRAIIPLVSRCHKTLPLSMVKEVLSYPTFFPYVLCDGEEIVGYAEIHRLPHFGRGFDGRLEKVIIVEKHRGKKLAQKFCAFLCEVAKTSLECGRMDLTVEKPDAKAVYTHLGFSKVDTEVWRAMF
eukprot:Blabericola_migrator_1__5142@NODE_2656_length_2489_cov_252_649050_g1609_i2_p2_GENE_NODE_2656_length_2489_cov_252_649050_g1609_i2NODE_2656_length_2489_cov_252_649050_g1609_i2_p2_ORF_typecomplete_len175_score27_00Acetyltransf_10/PF13673_7/5e10Acetyltransf_1/PF00583_25/2e09Acetyltransf_7/PF13508_7/2e06Acetyltransf_4/PF13420_7/8_3e06GNAT_acetyltran/PF12746_7/0_0011FR47/PF08445_10/0_0022Acetyltransf_3/PF13302_7/0_0017Acetyltransf_9/PF13527_7/0_018_NODE_2656_length_2489_cov_252_649050_g1609_i219472471